jgi:ADP-ribose pyrophosphatase YjhB (NUDIX family)
MRDRSAGWIRSAAKAVIIRDGQLLLTHCRDASGDWYALPGGGQQPEETLADCIARECREELGVDVSVGALLFVRDHIVANHDFSYVREAPHQIEHLFACEVPSDYQPASGDIPDTHQVGVEWMAHDALERVRVYPTWLREVMDPKRVEPLPIYWGDRG